jgi:hypothetical protein
MTAEQRAHLGRCAMERGAPVVVCCTGQRVRSGLATNTSPIHIMVVGTTTSWSCRGTYSHEHAQPKQLGASLTQDQSVNERGVEGACTGRVRNLAEIALTSRLELGVQLVNAMHKRTGQQLLHAGHVVVRGSVAQKHRLQQRCVGGDQVQGAVGLALPLGRPQGLCKLDVMGAMRAVRMRQGGGDSERNQKGNTEPCQRLHHPSQRIPGGAGPRSHSPAAPPLRCDHWSVLHGHRQRTARELHSPARAQQTTVGVHHHNKRTLHPRQSTESICSPERGTVVQQ